MTNRWLLLAIVVILPLWCSSKPLDGETTVPDSIGSGAAGETTTLSAVDANEAEQRTESTTGVWSADWLNGEDEPQSAGQSQGFTTVDSTTVDSTTVDSDEVANVTRQMMNALLLNDEDLPESTTSNTEESVRLMTVDATDAESSTVNADDTVELTTVNPDEYVREVGGLATVVAQDAPESTTLTAEEDVAWTTVGTESDVETTTMNDAMTFDQIPQMMAMMDTETATETSDELMRDGENDELDGIPTESEFTTQALDDLPTDSTEAGAEWTTAVTDPTLVEAETVTATEAATEATVSAVAKPALKRPADSTANRKRRSYEGYRVYRVILPTEESVQRVLAMEGEPGIDFWADPHLLLRPRGLFVTSAADIMASPKAIPLVEEVFRQSRLPFTVMVNNVQSLISQENPPLPLTRQNLIKLNGHSLTWQRYHRLGDIYSYADYLKETYPQLVDVIQIGKSSQGRPIKVIHLSRDVGNKGKQAIFIDAGVHGNEWIATSTLTWMVKQLVENGDQYDCILNQFDWYFAPVVNPDGYEYSHAVDRMWRKSRTDYSGLLTKIRDQKSSIALRKLRFDDSDHEEECRGADINRNFAFQWRKGGSSTNVCSGSFAGIRPFSEPESQALANFMVKRKKDIVMYISLHSYSQMWLLPWGYTEKKPQDFSQLFSLAKIGARALQAVHNTTFLIGTIPDLLYVASGSTQDWAKGVAGINYSYTIELRDAGERGMILPASQIVATGQETWAGVYAAARELAMRIKPPTYADLSSLCPVF